MTETHVACALRTGRIKRPLAQVVAELGGSLDLVFVWLEPANAARRTASPVGLLTPAKLSAEALCPLVEARFFYSQGLLHLLAEGAETRLAAWWEGEPGQSPAWLTAAVKRPDAKLKDAQDCAGSTTAAAPADGNARGLLRTERPIVLSQARSERGLRCVGDEIGAKVQAVEYFQDGQLRWWRIQRHG